MGPVLGEGVFPGREDGFRGDQRKKPGGMFGQGKEDMNGLFFVGPKRIADMTLFKVPAAIGNFEPQEGNFRKGGMFYGDTKHQEAEKIEEEVDNRHRGILTFFR